MFPRVEDKMRHICGASSVEVNVPSLVISLNPTTFIFE